MVDVELTESNGRAEREAALQMVQHSIAGRATPGADRQLRHAWLREGAALAGESGSDASTPLNVPTGIMTGCAEPR